MIIRSSELLHRLTKWRFWIYRATREFPKEEIYGLTSQMRRAAVLVPSNIVGGAARESQAKYLRFLEGAFGSLRELHYQFDLAKRLTYFDGYDISGCESKILEKEKVSTSPAIWVPCFDQCVDSADLEN